MYPRINHATSYRIDPTWPKRPPNMPWGNIPGVSVDKFDRVWMLTRANPPVQVYDTTGAFVRAWGDSVIQRGHSLEIDHDGNVWIADLDKHAIMQFTPEGKLLKTLGTPGVPGNDQTHMKFPTDMEISPTGDVFVSDGYVNTRIIHFDRDGRYVKAWGSPGSEPGQFNVPHAIARDSKGRFYVADRNNVRIQVFDENGVFLDQWNNLMVPWGIWITANDEVMVCGSSPMQWNGEEEFGCPPIDQIVMQFASSGKLLAVCKIPKGEDGKEQPGEVNWVHGIAMDSHGSIYLSDIRGKRVQKFVRQESEAIADNSTAHDGAMTIDFVIP